MIYIFLAHFDLFQFTRSVRQFDFEKIRIQDKKYFMQPCLVMPIILKWWFNYLSISLKGSLQWLDWSKYLTSPWPWRRNTHKQIFVQIAYIFSFPLPVCWKTKWEVFMKDKLLHLWIWKGFERKQLMLSTYFAWGLFFCFFLPMVLKLLSSR